MIHNALVLKLSLRNLAAVLWIAQVVGYQLHIGEDICNPTQTMRAEFHGCSYLHVWGVVKSFQYEDHPTMMYIKSACSSNFLML